MCIPFIAKIIANKMLSIVFRSLLWGFFDGNAMFLFRSLPLFCFGLTINFAPSRPRIYTHTETKNVYIHLQFTAIANRLELMQGIIAFHSHFVFVSLLMSIYVVLSLFFCSWFSSPFCHFLSLSRHTAI